MIFSFLAGLASATAEAPDKASLLAPFRAGGNDGLSNLVLIPGMESAITLGKRGFRADLSTEITDNNFKEVSGTDGIDISGETYESHLRLAYGVLSYLDLSVDFSFTAYSEDVLAVTNGQSFFTNVEADREVTDPVLEAKFQFWGGEREGTGLAIRAAVKTPVGDTKDVHSTGAFDYSGGLLWTLDLDWGIWHANLNYTTVGEHEIFRQEANVDLQDVVSVGLSYMFEIKPDVLAVGAQAFGYLNPFRDVQGSLEGLEGTPVSALVGLRWYPRRRFSFELGLGPGITSDAADFTAFVGLAYQL
ncbi:MAG: transporter [Planctomycetes bacterium]|nr:transporter [Planctomycetota bacterium]